MALVLATYKAALRAAMLAAPSIQAIDNAALTALVDAICAATDAYIRTATVTIPSGIAVATAGSATAQTGATTAPGVGAIT